MKLRFLLLTGCMFLVTTLFAANVHQHPKANNGDSKQATKKPMRPGYCEIEIINDSASSIVVNGTYDDGSFVDFKVYPYDAPHYISLDYYGYCHPDMYIEMYTPYNKIYSGYTKVNSTLRIVPYLNKQATVNVSAR